MRRSSFISLMVVSAVCSSVAYSEAETRSAPPSGSIVTERQGLGGRVTETTVATPEGKTAKEVTVETKNGTTVSGYALGSVANGVMVKGISVTSPDRPVTFTTPENVSMTITLPTGETVTIPGGTDITIPPDTTIAKQQTTQDITVTTKRPYEITLAGTNKTITIPQGTSFTIPSGTVMKEVTNPNGLTNFNDATGWSTSTIIRGPNGDTLFMPGSPANLGPSQ